MPCSWSAGEPTNYWLPWRGSYRHAFKLDLSSGVVSLPKCWNQVLEEEAFCCFLSPISILCLFLPCLFPLSTPPPPLGQCVTRDRRVHVSFTSRPLAHAHSRLSFAHALVGVAAPTPSCLHTLPRVTVIIIIIIIVTVPRT